VLDVVLDGVLDGLLDPGRIPDPAWESPRPRGRLSHWDGIEPMHAESRGKHD